MQINGVSPYRTPSSQKQHTEYKGKATLQEIVIYFLGARKGKFDKDGNNYLNGKELEEAAKSFANQ